MNTEISFRKVQIHFLKAKEKTYLPSGMFKLWFGYARFKTY